MCRPSTRAAAGSSATAVALSRPSSSAGDSGKRAHTRGGSRRPLASGAVLLAPIVRESAPAERGSFSKGIFYVPSTTCWWPCSMTCHPTPTPPACVPRPCGRRFSAAWRRGGRRPAPAAAPRPGRAGGHPPREGHGRLQEGRGDARAKEPRHHVMMMNAKPGEETAWLSVSEDIDLPPYVERALAELA